MNVANDSLKRSTVLFMAIICGVCVANLYYMQPLLSQLTETFHISQSAAGLVVTLTQIGYALGLFMFVPLGDMKESRSLITKMMVVLTVVLLVVSISLNYPMLLLASFLVGLTTIIPQIVIPLAAHTANSGERGRVIGTLMSGLLMGILLSRTFSGVVGGFIYWRAIYVSAAVMVAVLLLLTMKWLPQNFPTSQISYKELMASIWPLFKKQKMVRESAINGALMFGSFSAFWTSLIFLLETPIYGMGTKEAGLLGLLGVAGVLTASVVGRLSDKKDPRFMVGVGIVFSLVAYICFSFYGLELWGLILGIILLSMGNQTAQVSNQTRIQSVADGIRNRNNMIFMVFYFIGGAAGSFLGGFSWQYFGWMGVCAVGVTFQSIALFVHFVVYRR